MWAILLRSLDKVKEDSTIKKGSDSQFFEKIITVFWEKINRCYMVQFISNKKIYKKNNSKITVVAPPGAIDRSPCGTGTSARVAQLFTKGKLKLNQKFHNEGPLGTKFIGKVISSKMENKILYIRPQVSGRAYITGINEIILDKNDPIQNGFRVGSKGKL